MSVASLINWIISHNIVVIETLVGVIAISVLALAFRQFFSNAREELGITDSKSLSSLEESLKKVIEKVNLGAVPAGAPAGGGVLSAESTAEFEELKKTFETKQRENEELQGQINALKEMSSDSAEAAQDRAKLEVKAKELEAKLAEYEIISEDIADLSMYKEENVKLKREIEALKEAAAAAPVAPAAVAAAAPSPEPAVAETPPAQAPAPAAAAATDAPAQPEFAAALDDDIMAEFAKAVENQLGSKSGAAAPAPVPEPPAAVTAAAPEPVIEEPAVVAVAAPATAAVAAPPAAAVASPAPVAAPAGIQDASEDDAQSMVDDLLAKMSEEAGTLAAAVSDDDEIPNAIDATMDADKLAAEAETIEKIKQEDVQLMGQFENFVKKGAS